jgi:hypothetical protein
MVFAGGTLPSQVGESRTRRQTQTSTQSVNIATGSVLGGLDRSAVLATGPSGSFSNLYVTVAQPNVGYVVWQGPSTSLHLAVICAGKRVVSNREIVADAIPLALFPLSGGRAAVVFDKYGHGTPLLDYALLSPTGQMGKIARIAHPGGRDTAATELSVSPSGQLIAAWVHDDGASPPGTPPSSNRFIPAQLVITRCRTALRCGSPQRIALGPIRAACINPAVAISPDGAVTVIAAANDWGGTGCDKPLGVRASVTAASSAKLAPMRLIQSEGDWPIAEPAGQAGTVMVFNSGLARSDSFSSSFLPAATGTPATTSLLDRGGFYNTGQQLLAPTSNGWYLITWSHANRRDNPDVSLDAAVGHDGQLQSAAVALHASQHISSYLGATDGHGNAIILFDGSTDTGDGAAFPYTSGLYTTVSRRK